MSRRLWLRRAILAAASALVSLLLCELLVRSTWHNPYRFESPDRVVRLSMSHARTDRILSRALVDPESPTVRFRTDERSYVRPARRFDRPDATLAFLGGSTTECWPVREDLRFPALVSRLLEERGLRVDVLNAGKSGNTTHDAINLLLNHVAADRPDAVVLMEAANDIGLLEVDGSYRSRMGRVVGVGEAGRWVLQTASSWSALVGLLRDRVTSKGITSLWMKPPTVAPALRRLEEEYARRLRAFARVADALGIRPVLATQPMADLRTELTPPWTRRHEQDAFNEIARRVGAEEGALVIDLARHVERDVPGANEPMNVFYDGIHVTDHGSRVYAEYLANHLEPLLREVARASGESLKDARQRGAAR
jgi:lysophospholipase L1-like esterase